MTQEVLDEDCPKLQGPHSSAFRLGRRGRFIGCSGFRSATTREIWTAAATPREARPSSTSAWTRRRSWPSSSCKGPFGWYFQLGEAEGDKKPKRVSLPKNVAPEAADLLAIALKMLALPRDLGRTRKPARR